MTLTIFADGVERAENRKRIDDAARLLGGRRGSFSGGRLIAVENSPGACSIYDRGALRIDATLAVGNERRGLSRRTLDTADEVVAIPTMSRLVTTLNVAAAAAVAGWYVLHGSPPQPRTTVPEKRRPALLIVGDDHVEVGSTLRSAAAFGYRDVALEDRRAGWFDGSSAVRREAYAAARRHKNALRIRRGQLSDASAYEEVVAVLPWAEAPPLRRLRLTRGARQLVILGASRDDLSQIQCERVSFASLDLIPVERAPLRLVASIALAEVARQVGRKRPLPGRPLPRRPVYDAAIPLTPDEQFVLVAEPSTLLEY